MATFHEIETADSGEPWGGDGLPPALWRLARAAVGAVVVLALAYVAPGAERFRPWTEEDQAPFSGMFDLAGAGPVVAEAGGNTVGIRGLDDQAIAALRATAALADPESGEPEITPAWVTEEHRIGEALEDRGAEAPAEGTQSMGEGRASTERRVTDPEERAASPQGTPAGPEVRVPPGVYEGLPAEIEDPSGAMGPFYEALKRTALGEAGAITRIAHWGDSAIGADGMTSMTRRLLQRELGDAGHGWILVASGSAWYKHKDISYEASESWKALKIIDKGARDGRYGFGGVAARGYLGASARFRTVPDGPVGQTVSRFEVHYLQAPRHGSFQLSVDGGEPVVVDTGGEVADAVRKIEVPDGHHELHIRALGGGPVRLYGVVLEREGPGVVYDSLGLVGARGSRLLNADPAHWQRQLEIRAPDLMVLMYGGNDLDDKRISMETYRQTFRDLVRRYRTTRPQGSCLVMSPLDHGERHRGQIRTVPRLLEMMAVQKEVALEEGCAWYSVFDAMGGEGAMGRWYKATPKLGWGDYAHPTAAGSRVLGRFVFQALMKGLADHLAATAP